MEIDYKKFSYAFMTVVVIGMVVGGVVVFIDSLNGKVARSWISPSNWLYVRWDNGTIRTAYGDFNFSDDGLQMFKNKEYFGTLKVGRSKYLNHTNATMFVDCNELEKWCDLNITWNQDSLFLHFDQFRLKASYQLENKGNKTLKDRIYLILDTPSKIKKDSENATLFENTMSFNIEDIRRSSPGIIDYKSTSSKGLVYSTKTIKLDPGKKFIIDPSWSTPTAVESDCGYTGYPSSNTIDGDESTRWKHTTNEIHWVIYNTGSSQTIDQLKLTIGDPDGFGSEAPCELTAIYVCDDNACSSESSLGTCTFSGSAGNHTCDITNTVGQWIRIDFKSYTTSCGAKAVNTFYEFYYLVEAVTTTTTVPADTCTYPGSGDWNLICNDNCTLQNNNTVVTGTLNINTTTGSLTLINTNLTVYNISNEGCPIWMDSTSRFWIGS